MRKIRLSQIATFSVLVTLAVAAAAVITALVLGQVPLADFRGVVMSIAFVLLVYVFSIALYRGFLRLFPLREGYIEEHSQQEFIYHVYVLFYLLLFYPIMRSGFVPTPLMRLFYLALGTKLGSNTYSQGIIHDPPFIEVGANSVIGQSALLIPHVIEGDRLAHFPIRIGDHVTIGAGAAILADVVIGDRAIVATGAVVPKGARIGAGEVWGGVPAKRLQARQEPTSTRTGSVGEPGAG